MSDLLSTGERKRENKGKVYIEIPGKIQKQAKEGIMCKSIVSKTLLILGVLALAAVPLFGQWQGDFRVTNNPGGTYTASYGGWVIAADDANVHIAYKDNTNVLNYYVRYFTFPIGSPAETSNGEMIGADDGGHHNSLPIAIHDGTVDISWYSHPLSHLYTREKNGSWGSIIEHGVDVDCCCPAIAFDSDGNLHNVFNHYSSTTGDAKGRSVYYQRKNSGASSYSSPIMAFDPHSDGGSSSTEYFAYYPSICVTSDDALHVSVAHNNGNLLKHVWSTDGGATWNNETIGGTNFARYKRGTSICHDSDDNLYIAYADPGSACQVYVATNASGSWVSTQVSEYTGNYSYWPSICCDTFNNVWISWDSRWGSGSITETHYNKYDAVSGSWGYDQALTLNDGRYSRYANFAADENGNVHIIWTDSRDDGNFEIYYNWFLGDTITDTIPPSGRDLAVVRILKPLGKVDKVPVTPEAVITNFGGDVDSGYAMCRITGPGVNYDKGNLEGIVYLEAGEEDAVSFPSWTPSGWPGDRYKVEVTVYLWPEKTTKDDDPTNNTRVEYATIQSAVQVDAIEVVKPEEGSVVDSMTPDANFKNVGTEAAENFYCYCEIVSQGYHTADYLDSVPVANLDPEEVKNVKFAKWTCDDYAFYEATFFAAIPGATHTLLGRKLFVVFQGTPLVGIAESADALRIEVTCPNPFISGTLVSYAVGYPISTTIRVYDVTGQVVHTLHEGELSGSGSLYWDGTDDDGAELAGGLYFIRIAAPGFTKTAKVVLLH
ncbi:hypothetical protein CEE36_02005 [candidate division TA06 bacterium B3_TA06]|uniref:FlgD/Vpr Ig-like domain-containing protein n=1 Tax=candidate division TA06 bacterium B3_TA06 TaxID=2012487 RepID=A0A532V9M5_UNCT6|nr:MAG: hypothetical protein CEE36_02005 [candidate division TA06 bacterium B3_TA06]